MDVYIYPGDMTEPDIKQKRKYYPGGTFPLSTPTIGHYIKLGEDTYKVTDVVWEPDRRHVHIYTRKIKV